VNVQPVWWAQVNL